MRPTRNEARAFAERLRGVNYATRVKACALALLALTALLNNLSYVFENRRYVPAATARVRLSDYEKRFDALRRVMPAHGVVGYVSDETDEIEEAEKYYLTQYALAPLVVVRGADRPLVVGNFGHGGRDAAAAANPGLKPVQDFGDGLVLFGREEK